METFTLVIVTTAWFGLRTNETRRPGYTEIECKLRAAEVQKPKRARCDPEPSLEPPAPTRITPRPAVVMPANAGLAPPRTGYVICPYVPPCWRDGVPIHGATGEPFSIEETEALIKS